MSSVKFKRIWNIFFFITEILWNALLDTFEKVFKQNDAFETSVLEDTREGEKTLVLVLIF